MENSVKPPTWFWVVAIFMLIWNLMGVGSFVMHMGMTGEAIAALPEEQQQLYTDYPLWATVFFGLAVGLSTLGSIGLVMRKKWSRPVFLAAFVFIIIQMVHNLFFTKSMEVYGPGAAVMPVMIIIVGLFLIWMSSHTIKKNWIT